MHQFDPIQQKENNQISGTIEKITFHNPETGFFVLQIRSKDDLPLTVIGTHTHLSPGETIEVTGRFETNQKFGMQFRATHISVVQPSTVDDIKKYLASGAIKGVGPHYANILVNHFGENVFHVLDHEPARLDEIAGIGKKRKKQLLLAWQEQKNDRDVLFFLQTHGLGAARAVSIQKRYGNQAIDLISHNPYQLIQDIPGIGFKTADSLAEKLGIAKDSAFRAAAGIKYLLQLESEKGHTCARENELVRTAQALLMISESVLLTTIASEVDKGLLLREDTEEGALIFLKSFYHAEVTAAKQLERISQGKVAWEVTDGKATLDYIETRTKLRLSPSQEEVVLKALQTKLFIITGGPGVGKTTIVKSVLTAVKRSHIEVALCAPTGRAAKRLSETTGRHAKTIHRLLGFDPITRRFKHDALSPLEAELVIVDEASMLDIQLLKHLLIAIPDEAALFFIGDVDQLPSVGPGAVLSDLIESKQIPTARLTEIFRQAKSSNIIVNAHRINQGELPETIKFGESDFYCLNVFESQSIKEKVLELVTKRIPDRFGFDPVHDIQVLVPMNRGLLGTKELNKLLQQTLNGDAEPKLERLEGTFAPYDKVMQIVNNYEKEVFNGDIGQIVSVNLAHKTCRVDFDGRLIDYGTHELEELTLAYAMSIHKSQGSEYKAVVIPLSMQHERMLAKNLLYTAVTRGKSLVIIVGHPQAVQMAVNRTQANDRQTRLKERVAEIFTGVGLA